MSAAEMGTPQPGQPCYEARRLGCTCVWIRGFDVGEVREEWCERILKSDPACPVPGHDGVVAT